METGPRLFSRGRYAVLHIRTGSPYPDANAPQIAADARFPLSDDIWIEDSTRNSLKTSKRPANLRTTESIISCTIDIFMHSCGRLQRMKSFEASVSSLAITGQSFFTQ